jgi:hypothetical protein
MELSTRKYAKNTKQKEWIWFGLADLKWNFPRTKYTQDGAEILIPQEGKIPED